MSSVYYRKDVGLDVHVSVDLDGNYIAWVPELPGCVAGDETLEGALREITYSMDAVLDVLKMDDPVRYRQITLGVETTSKQTQFDCESTEHFAEAC